MKDVLFAVGVIALIVGSVVLVVKNSKLFLYSLIILAVVLVLAVVYPLVIGFGSAGRLTDGWQIAHIIGAVVGGLFTLTMKLFEKQNEEEDSPKVSLGVFLTLLWIIGFAFLRKYMDVL